MDEEIFVTLPEVIPVEFRLYYDDNGLVLFYTCEKPEGKFIVVDSQTYAECRHDLRVVDGKLQPIVAGAHVSRYVKSSTGVKTAIEDINILVDDSYDGLTNTWELVKHEL